MLLYATGNGDPHIYYNGMDITVYKQAESVQVMELYAGDVLTASSDSSDGNGNGSSMMACVVLKGDTSA